MPTDRDAAFREALDALIFAAGSAAGFTFTTGGGVNHPTAQRLLAAEARVLALYAEREGEEYVIRRIEGARDGSLILHSGFETEHIQGNPLKLRPGDRVRVTKVEEGA